MLKSEVNLVNGRLCLDCFGLFHKFNLKLLLQEFTLFAFSS